MPTNCLECGEALRGRRDKKYCDDACRNAYHNRQTSPQDKIIRRVNRRLQKNHHLLCKLNPHGKTVVPRRQLLDLGFSFEYYTSIYETRKGDRYYFVYDQGYLPLENRRYALVQREIDFGI